MPWPAPNLHPAVGMAECAKGIYRPRRPRETAFYRLVEEHYERFEQVYAERYEDRYGFFRTVIRETVYKYLGCGDLRQGFARVRCRECGHEYLLAYPCKRRYFCTSCHTKRAVAFAEWLHTTVLWPVAHRQIVLTTHKMVACTSARTRFRRRSSHARSSCSADAAETAAACLRHGGSHHHRRFAGRWIGRQRPGSLSTGVHGCSASCNHFVPPE